ncbi:extracellular solute-binding protein [Paenibacillus faecis]|uniref:extracellular solute-binding protein n=1 Tax=Paenibacillus faecis TaxID=862114 RepID=UPI001BD0C9EC|nr:extracellular solute-binding protein [Paenibacillus faecis]
MYSKSIRLRRMLILLAAMLVMLSACGGQSQTAGNKETGSGASGTNGGQTAATASAEPETQAKDEGVLTVYLNDFDEMIGPMFEEATGYKVELVPGNGAEVMSRIQAEKGNPHWDVVWIDAMPSIYALGQEGQLLERWTPENANLLTDKFKSFVPENKTFYPTGAHAAGVIVYNKNELKEGEAPTRWSDFSLPQYKDMIGMADPAVAAPAYPFVSWFFNEQGLDQGKAYFDGLFANGLRVYPKNPNVVTALSSGEIKVAALQESNAYKMVNNGDPIEIVWPEEGAPASVRVAAIQKDTKNPNAAKAFIDFLLNPKTQQALIDKGEEAYFEPSAKDVKPKGDRDPDAKLVNAEAAWAAEHEAEIKQWFADKAVQ